MNVFVLTKHIELYDEEHEITVGVFNSMQKSLDKISKLEKIVVSDVLIDKLHSNENILWTENMFKNEDEKKFNACYSVEKFTLND